MQYLLLIYGEESRWADMSEADRNASYGKYMQFTKDIIDSKNYIGGEALQGIATATTVRLKGGKVVATDGPFAETKEQLGGYYLVEAKDLDEAIAIAGRIPNVEIGGCVEVRPIMPTPRME